MNTCLRIDTEKLSHRDNDDPTISAKISSSLLYRNRVVDTYFYLILYKISMAKVVFTPWKTQSQLLAVRDQFYPPSSHNGPDLRPQACAKVCIFSLFSSI